jgi:GNAT superfamily N-acetyltransferase
MPQTVSIVPVKNKADQKAFIQFAWDHYAGDPYWVPPIRSEIKGLLNYRKHPFYDKSEIQTFLAYRNHQVVGRIAAIIDGFHNDYHKERRGMFGFFESIDDGEVAKALFDAAKQWFADRDIFQLRGPANPSQNYEWGMLVDGFEEMPTFMMTYNKPYYGELVQQNGFMKSQDMYAYIGRMDQLDDLDPKMLRIVQEATKRFNIKVRPVSKKSFAKDIQSFLYIYNRAVAGQWGFTPLSQGELEETAGGLKHLIVPEMTTMAEIDGKVVGAVFGLLDYNPLIKKIDGRLFPFGIFRLLWGRKKLKRVRLLSTNVLPEYQRWGLGVVLMARLVPECKDWGLETGEFSWVLESNKLSRGTLERGGATKTKTYRIYDYDGAENCNSVTPPS